MKSLVKYLLLIPSILILAGFSQLPSRVYAGEQAVVEMTKNHSPSVYKSSSSTKEKAAFTIDLAEKEVEETEIASSKKVLDTTCPSLLCLTLVPQSSLISKSPSRFPSPQHRTNNSYRYLILHVFRI